MLAVVLLVLLILILGSIFYFVVIWSPEKHVEIEHVDLDSVEKKKGNLPYVKKSYYMTVTELAFFKALENFNQNKYFIVPQVSLAKLVSVEYGEIMKKTYNNKIDRKSVDFVLFDKTSFLPQLVIELDDRSHDRWDRKERDNWIDGLMNKVGLKIIHIKAAHSYDLMPVLSSINDNQTQKI
jgi:very-short-patch-repair endonuclease